MVVGVCAPVSHQWKEVIDHPSFWKERCRREGYYTCHASKISEDWRLFYFLCKKRRNLIKNPSGQEQLKGWDILRSGGDGWAVHSVRHKLPDKTIRNNFVTSYNMCSKSQLIDLEKEGYNPSFMDRFQPDIRISEWFSPRSDCTCKYNLTVELLNQSRTVVRRFAPGTIYFKQENHEEWNKINYVFQNYGRGVRYVRFIHRGKDLRYWKGWYGIRVTGSCVEICPRGAA